MKLVTRVAALALTAVAATYSLKAENNAAQQEDSQQAAAAKKDYSKTNSVATGKDVKAPVVAATTSPTFTCLVSENYDSRYMFRGQDVLAGTGILSTTFAPTWHITANDAITVPLWFATAVQNNKNASSYRELDVPINYLHTFDSGFNMGAGYTLYNYFNSKGLYANTKGGTAIQNEVNVTGGYSKTLKNGVTLNSSLTYFYELGTAKQYSYGSINPGSSFLTPSLGATIPLNFIKKDGSVTFNPNTQYNFSFAYTGTQTAGYVTGANNWQLQLPVTWQVTKVWSVTGYWAYSYQGINIYNTAPSLGWAGCSIGASF